VLACVLEIQVLMLKIQAKLSDDSTEVLRQCLNISGIDDINETGWEETVLATLQHFLRSSLNKNAPQGAAGQMAQGAG
jgi:hypothetical protein